MGKAVQNVNLAGPALVFDVGIGYAVWNGMRVIVVNNCAVLLARIQPKEISVVWHEVKIIKIKSHKITERAFVY